MPRRGSRRRKAGIATGVAALLLVASVVVTGLILVYRPLPTIDGEYRLLGIEQRAEVLRDEHGVPHIYAQTAHDLFYLQGYVTAQDRLFQMDLYRRAGAGRLAEVLGEPALDSDRYMRTIGLARVAAGELPLVREDTRAALVAYADGVNKFLEQHGESLPIEFLVLGYRPAKWTAVDSIVVAKLQAYDAATNYRQELLRANLALRFGTEVLATLMPDPATRSAAVDASAWAAVAPLLSAGIGSPGEAALRAVLPAAGLGAGSNCWALSGPKTASGKPILAGDTHLAVRNPSIWYEIGLEGAGYKLVGFSFAGIPAIVIGHNDRIAWSLTYAYTDTQDLFVERQDPADPRRYEYRGAFEPATFIREVIGVKGRSDPVVVDVAITRHGPIITPILKDQAAPLALRWTALDPARLLDFVFELARARSWAEFRAAAADFTGAAVSACYADVDGHIGYQLIGRLPARKGDGQMPVPGWTGEYDWSGLLAADANPSVSDPPAGMIVNANDRPTQDPRGVGYVGEWDPAFRATYISQRLAAIPKADLAAMRALQTDFTSPPVARFREAILSATTGTDLGREAQAVVRSWDGRLGADSPGAAVYETWFVGMCESVFKDKLGDALYREYADDGRMGFALYQLIGRPSDPWFAELGDAAVRGRDAIAGRALDEAARDLAARFGPDPKAWRWGDVHTITFKHPLAIGPLALLLNIGPLKRPGDGYSVNNQAYSLVDPFAVDTHPSQRMIADLSDLDAALSVTPEGQSGQPGSKFWGDQAPLWAAGDYKPMRFSREKLGRIEGELVFRPR
ncbi:MAG TPA: penicillin acylase family protein [Candidatus Limnocylindria bacterium]|jgi:penicillin amidase|nr:penicillin acylase family protein [Candidatus Limnocylindria bacterium]